MEFPLIAPSILAGNFGRIDEEIEMLNASTCDWIHVDIMDGVFVPNISFGFPVLEAIRRKATKPLDVHLMIVNPDAYLERLRDAGATRVTVHYEVCPHLNRTLSEIKRLGMQSGIAINPHTSVSLLHDSVMYTDMVLVMSVNPGFGGQKFIPNTYSKVTALRALCLDRSADCLIEIDGGVDMQNAAGLCQAGAQVLVAGSSIFSSPNPHQTIEDLRSSAIINRLT